MARRKFLRAGYWKYSKLGLRRKNKQVYRKAKGGDNKVRLNEKGRLKKVKVGYRHKKTARGLVRGLKPVMIRSIEDLKNIQKNEIGIIAKMGHKKRLEIATEAQNKNIALNNLNPKKFIVQIEKKLAQKKRKRGGLVMKKEEKEKRTKDKEVADKKIEEKEQKQEHEHAHEHHAEEKNTKEEHVKETNKEYKEEKK